MNRIGSLCTGYGGLDLAVERVLGGEMVWYSEFESGPSKLLSTRFPGIQNLGDLTRIDWASLPAVDILTGGYPCQPFSVAGKRQGENDSRHLWPYIREAIRILRPGVTILENVSGHRSMGFGDVLRDCAEDGLDVRWVSVRAADAGAPHRRERLFFVVSDADRERREEHGLTGPLEEESGNIGGVDALPLLATPQARDSKGAPKDGFCNASLPRDVQNLVLLRTPQSLDGSRGIGKEVGGFRESGNPRQISLPGQVVRHLPESEDDFWGKYGPAVRRWEMLTRPAPRPTEPGRGGNPRLSTKFSEWMMGLPEGWVTDPGLGLSRIDQLKLCGNGVVPQQAEIALRYLTSNRERIA